MDNKAKISKGAERDRCWAAMRDIRDELYGIVQQKHSVHPMDFLIMSQCLALVLTDIELYGDEFLDVDEEELELLKDSTPAGFIARVNEEKKSWKVIEDEKRSYEERQDAIDKIRKSLWGLMTIRKDSIINLFQNFPDLEGPKDYALLMQCVSMVLVGLDLRKTELEILEN